MSNSSLFYRCLCFSALAHAGFLLSVPYKILSYQPAKPPLEVAYVQSLGEDKDEGDTVPQPQGAKTEPLTPSPLPFQERKDFLGDFLKTEIFKPKKTETLAKIDAPETSKKRAVQTPNVPGETYQTPEYKNYYQIVREKIRRQAYRNYKRLQQGDIFLTFILSASGELMESRVIREKSSTDAYLQSIALESVRLSAPFPQFPPKLKSKDRLSFNVIISFELK
ncbi:MAG: TonB family protein [Candidatus Omnitrophota bacterium]